MPRLDCDRCQAKLWIPKDYPEPFFTCPRCLAKIPKTYAETPAATVEQPVALQDVLQMSWGTNRIRPADHDALNDIKGTSAGLVLLACLSLLGLFATFESTLASGGTGMGSQVFVVSLVVLFATGLLLAFTQESLFARQIGRGILALFGVIIAGIVGVIAFIILLGMVCKAVFG